jgi:hypothetical protein
MVRSRSHQDVLADETSPLELIHISANVSTKSFL